MIKNATVVLCYVWGFGYLLEAVIRIILLYIIDIHLMVYVSIMAPFVFSTIMGVWSWFFTKRIRAKILEERPSILELDVVKTLS